MSILQKSVQALSQKEIINYKIYTNRIKTDSLRKDVKLFKLLKTHKKNDSNEDDFFEKLYTKKDSRNVYAQLRARLLIEVNNSLVQFYFHETDVHYVYSELSLYKIYSAKNEWEVAHYHLTKAEARALKTEDFAILSVIYMEYLNLSHYYDAVSPTEYIKKREYNDIKLSYLKTLDDLITTATYQLKRHQTFSKKQQNYVASLEKAIKKTIINKVLINEPVFKSRLYVATCLLLLFKRDYVALANYSIETYTEFSKKGFFCKNNHDLKLKMLCYICNALCAQQKYQQALDYLKIVKSSMSEFKNAYYNNYVFFYYNSLANNFVVLNPLKAIDILSEASDIKAIKNHPRHLGYIYLSLAGVCFDLKKHKLGLTNITKLYNHTVYKTLDDAFKINIAIIEIVLQLEAKHNSQTLDLVDKLMVNYKLIFKSEEYKQELDFLVMIKQLITEQEFKLNAQSVEIVKVFCIKNYKHASNSIIHYATWLEEKFL